MQEREKVKPEKSRPDQSGPEQLRVLIAASEITPYAKSGGLGDVIGSLPFELSKLGVDVRVVFPKYKCVGQEYGGSMSFMGSFTVNMGWRSQSASIHLIEGDVPLYCIENDYYFGRDGFYGYGDDYERFAFFSKAAIEFLTIIDFSPDIIHFNDWQCGLGCVYLRDKYSRFKFFEHTKSVFTIHNLRYQGIFGRRILECIDLNDGYFVSDKLEFYGSISLLKAGITYADVITTVSETYAKESQTPQFSYGMDGILRARSHEYFGVLNGIDTVLNDPATDADIYANFTPARLKGKKDNKKRLQEQLGLPVSDVPLIGIVSRLVDQKGFDLISVSMEELIGMNLQIVVLGTGEGRYEQLFQHMQWRAPQKVSANIRFDEKFAKQIYAGADMFLMPSIFEPCGLGQLFAMRYGTAPIVRKTGGLADTVKHFDRLTGTGNGFVFEDFVASGMMWALNEAVDMYNTDKKSWARLVRNAMKSDFSWNKSAEKYKELYNKLVSGDDPAAQKEEVARG